MSELLVNISKLSVGQHTRSLETQPIDIGLDARFSQPVRVNVSLEKSARQLFLNVKFETSGTFSCDRCLEDFTREVSGSYSIVYMMDGRSAEGIEAEEEIQVLTPQTNIVDLGEDVRQFLLLSLPSKTLCRENCAGLCPLCGVNKNRTSCACQVATVDPRWAVLKQIQKN
jgi:uncharacterized protein